MPYTHSTELPSLFRLGVLSLLSQNGFLVPISLGVAPSFDDFLYMDEAFVVAAFVPCQALSVVFTLLFFVPVQVAVVLIWRPGSLRCLVPQS